ncbi:tRNA (adenosine(37)-N6)-threonylcarbamoyltransferase complex dimerization subunit type 1 TsaB [Actinotalea sp.]|uniref:tRNA (adenosine(37)-N6)-threonylcarbamoyltransferase complex dimerization subunit type 1 TsaB n=1 Tax=Actinotalea sp. TaxID=1872145 RepID=UPI002C9519F9|nr:tRNA (adenosine(37)-N6)-threonylcarbamoyltransferase complex dimerization subunit type 1 TsaB [Actinotalea sp.]HQY33752.1 tRNA (adenosine(37)-N6)-threonylcarbamoyltransferase complex dimerization subunit type 1 TsaB [Actinotalea sp.]HRA51232.1 tRNA (adenosine(37)-N6)-threonylcarbamoyltransferase complex dimerization subunit type 1 TsaB [Actinotalea sp.]
MLVLALDTSADITVALVRDGATLAARRAAEQRRHAELLAPLVAEVLAEAGRAAGAIEAVVVGTGPAPFTGLRAGLVTARTLAWSLGVPVLGVCSLDAYAAQAYEGCADRDAEVLVVTDARRREVYAARYRWDGPDGDVACVEGPAVLHAATLAADPSTARSVVVGPGAGLYPDDLTAAPGAPTVLDPAVLARLATLRAATGRDQPTAPLYLRRPDVMPSAARKRATG